VKKTRCCISIGQRFAHSVSCTKSQSVSSLMNFYWQE